MAIKEVNPDPGAALYSRFLDGDAQSFAALVKTYKDALINFIAAIIGDETDAEDIAIDAFAVLMSARKKCHENVTFKTFLFAIGKNLAFKYLRKHKNKALSLSLFVDGIRLKQKGTSFEDDFFREMDRKHISECMERLKPAHRSVLYLLFFENLKYAEAGRVMGKSEGQIRGLVYRAKEALKTMLVPVI